MQNIYVLSDIAQVIIAAKAEQHNWPLLAYPKRLKLPTDLYRAQGSSSDVNQNQNRSFLSDEQREMIRSRVLKHVRTSKAVKPNLPDDKSQITPKKRRSATKKRPSKRSRNDSENGTPPTSERRLSARQKKIVDYANASSEDSENDTSESVTSSDNDE